ncbi:hypothetical protein [Bradyrhizobium aeschynomenes]|uniref:hypothetical protein n=1 Tax=Bradyrhizobium aeschynomenes TaxID=2734909 RepID=UPI0015560538|nr:hypothetical protein [Bradyrhizobium aeschynomenes]
MARIRRRPVARDSGFGRCLQSRIDRAARRSFEHVVDIERDRGRECIVLRAMSFRETVFGRRTKRLLALPIVARSQIRHDVPKAGHDPDNS